MQPKQISTSVRQQDKANNINMEKEFQHEKNRNEDHHPSESFA